MTDREAMQQALAALDRVMSHGSAVQEAKDILRERLAQPQRTHWEGCEEVHPECRKQRREWVSLTDDDIAQAMYRADAIITGPMQFKFAREVEANLKEKNNG